MSNPYHKMNQEEKTKMKYHAKRFFAIFLAAVLTLGLAACGGNDESDGPKTTLTVVADSDLGDMSPFGSSTSFSYFQEQVYEPLFALGYNMEETPRLAKSWDRVDDQHYTFHLNDGICDSAGNPITANDVIFSLKLYLEDSNYSQYVSHIDFDKTVATDDKTVDIYFADTNAFAFSQLAGVRIVTQAAWEASPDRMVTTPVGSGPYKYKEYVGGSYFILEANDKYWGEQPTIREIRFNIVSEPAQRTTQLETGAADIVMNLQASDVEYIRGKDHLEVDCHTSVQSMTMFFNMDPVSAMSSKELRQGVCWSIDNEAINNLAYGGFCAPSKAFFSTAMTDYTDDMAKDIYTTSDMGKAQELFAASGKAGSSIRIATDGSQQETTIAEIIQTTLLENGFNVTIDNYDPATIWSVASDPTQWDLLLMITAAPSGNGVDKMFAFLAGLNFSKWSGESFDTTCAKLMEATNTLDTNARLALTKEALDIVEEEVPAYSMVMIAQNFAYNTNLNFRVYNQASLYVADLEFNLESEN